MMENLINVKEQQIHNVLNSYWYGRNKPVENFAFDFEHDIRVHMDNLISQSFSPRVIKIIGRVTEFREKGLAAARLNQMNQAKHLFLEARKILALNSMPKECSLLLRSFQEPAEAYLDYRLGDLETARKRVNAGLIMVRQLINENDYEILDIRWVEMQHNLMRIEMQDNCWQKAIELGWITFDHITNLSTPWLANLQNLKSFSKETIDAISLFYANKLSVEIALLVARIERERLFKLLSYTPLFSKGEDRSLDLFDYQYAWLSLKETFIHESEDAFLDQAGKFLSQGKKYTSLLWYATLRDVYLTCSCINSPMATNLCNEFAAEIHSKKLPSPLQLPSIE